jgi:hypothetical protein
MNKNLLFNAEKFNLKDPLDFQILKRIHQVNPIMRGYCNQQYFSSLHELNIEEFKYFLNLCKEKDEDFYLI